MRRPMIFIAFSCLPACSSSSGSHASGPYDASSADVTQDARVADASNAVDSGATETGTYDAGGNDGSPDSGCPASWLAPPTVDPTIAVPADSGTVLLHAVGAGTQDYACAVSVDGGSSWSFVGPVADLSDCNGVLIGHHFASDAGAAYPEWQTTDGTYVIGHKVAAFTPDGGEDSVPWLLLDAVGNGGGSGTLSQVGHVQRVDTDGGVAPAGACSSGATAQVPYSAEYYFYGP